MNNTYTSQNTHTHTHTHTGAPTLEREWPCIISTYICTLYIEREKERREGAGVTYTTDSRLHSSFWLYICLSVSVSLYLPALDTVPLPKCLCFVVLKEHRHVKSSCRLCIIVVLSVFVRCFHSPRRHPVVITFLHFSYSVSSTKKRQNVFRSRNKGGNCGRENHEKHHPLKAVSYSAGKWSRK